jgi:hypothetical protein
MSEQAPQLVPDEQALARLSTEGSVQQLRAAYLGVWPTREDLGQQLLAEIHARERVEEAVPRWLADYVRLDGEAFIRDAERSGVYVISENDSSGISVFDGIALRPPHYLRRRRNR